MSQDPNALHHNIQHFLQLAKKGAIGAASGGEKRAHRIAKLLPKLIEDVPGLDTSALHGIIALLAIASENYNRAEEILQEAGFHADNTPG